MTFEASKSVTLWFKQWHTHTWGGYAATCLVLVVVCLIHEALTCYRARFHRLYLAEPEYQPLEPGSARGLETGSARGERATTRQSPAGHDPAAKERWAACSRSAQRSSLSSSLKLAAIAVRAAQGCLSSAACYLVFAVESCPRHSAAVLPAAPQAPFRTGLILHPKHSSVDFRSCGCRRCVTQVCHVVHMQILWQWQELAAGSLQRNVCHEFRAGIPAHAGSNDLQCRFVLHCHYWLGSGQFCIQFR